MPGGVLLRPLGRTVVAGARSRGGCGRVSVAGRARRGGYAAAGTLLAALAAPAAAGGLGLDEGLEEAAGVGAGLGRDLLGGAPGDEAAALLPAFGAHVDQAVGDLDDVEVVLDDDHGSCPARRGTRGR